MKSQGIGEAKGRSPKLLQFPFPLWRNSKGKEGNGGNPNTFLLSQKSDSKIRIK